MDARGEELKKKILGKKYNLSIVSANSKLIKKLNKIYRGKNKTTNVLSFPLSKTEGEIFINASLIKEEAKKTKISLKKYKDYIFIHSLLHLKGYKHGKKMEKEEEKIIKKLWEEIL